MTHHHVFKQNNQRLSYGCFPHIIIWNRQGHEYSCIWTLSGNFSFSRSSSASKTVKIFWAEIYGDDFFFRAESSLIQSSCRSFIRVIVPYEISKGNFRVETKILVSTVIGHKWVPKMADVICENLFPICYSLLNQCYLPLISNVHILHNAKMFQN